MSLCSILRNNSFRILQWNDSDTIYHWGEILIKWHIFSLIVAHSRFFFLFRKHKEREHNILRNYAENVHRNGKMWRWCRKKFSLSLENVQFIFQLPSFIRSFGLLWRPNVSLNFFFITLKEEKAFYQRINFKLNEAFLTRASRKQSQWNTAAALFILHNHHTHTHTNGMIFYSFISRAQRACIV